MPSDRYYIRDDQGTLLGPLSLSDLETRLSSNQIAADWSITTNPENEADAILAHRWQAPPSVPLGIASLVLGKNESLTPDEAVALFEDTFTGRKTTGSLSGKTLSWWTRWLMPRRFLLTTIRDDQITHCQVNTRGGLAEELDGNQVLQEIARYNSAFDWWGLLLWLLAIGWLVWLGYDWWTRQLFLRGVGIRTGVFFLIGFLCLYCRARYSRLYLGYRLDSSAERRLADFTNALAALQGCSQVWVFQMNPNASDKDWKYNAGETMQLDKLPAAIFNKRIRNLVMNVPVHGIADLGRAVYFLPDRVLVIANNDYLAEPYSRLRIKEDTLDRVHTEGRLYPDAKVVEFRWRFINKDGTPDRRFKDNEELPVVRFGILEFSIADAVFPILMTNAEVPAIVRGNFGHIRLIETEKSPEAELPVPHRPPQPLPGTGLPKKNCPYCGEVLLAIAQRCRYCDKWFNRTSRPIV